MPLNQVPERQIFRHQIQHHRTSLTAFRMTSVLRVKLVLVPVMRVQVFAKPVLRLQPELEQVPTRARSQLFEAPLAMVIGILWET